MHDLAGPVRESRDVPCRPSRSQILKSLPAVPPRRLVHHGQPPARGVEGHGARARRRIGERAHVATGLPVEDLDPPVLPARPIADERHAKRNRLPSGLNASGHVM